MALLLSLNRKSSLTARDEILQSFFVVVKEKKRGFVLHFEIQIQVWRYNRFLCILTKMSLFC